MKIDQIAYYCNSDEQADSLKQILGLKLSDWIKDTVYARSSVFSGPIEKNVAELQFNYDLGIELEIIRYIEGPSWHMYKPVYKLPYISHVGAHLDDGEDFPAMLGARLVQETWTDHHTSEYLTTGAGKGRKYHYRIYQLGTMNYLKFIRRINP